MQVRGLPLDLQNLDERPRNLHFNKFLKAIVVGTIQTPKFVYRNFSVGSD